MTLADMIGTKMPERKTGPLRILVAHRYYWPDTPPCASLIRRIASHWRQEGHHVDVLSSQPSYRPAPENQHRPRNDVVDGVNVERLNLPTEVGRPFVRVINALRLGGALMARALSGRYDVIMISTVPQVLGGAFAALAAKLSRARFIYHCMDIHPEVGGISGEFSNPVIFKVLRKIDSWSCKQADPVVALSSDMAASLRGRPHGKDFRIEVINNFSLPSKFQSNVTVGTSRSNDKLTLIYAGNLGRFQGLHNAIDAMAKLKGRSDIELVLMGEGVARADLEFHVQMTGANVRFLGAQSIETAKATIKEADIGFVSLVPDMYRYAYPSKTMTYLEQGCPIVAMIEDDSGLAREIREYGCGFSVAPGDAQKLASLLSSLAADDRWKERMRQNALQMFESEFSEEVVLSRWSDILLKQQTENRPV